MLFGPIFTLELITSARRVRYFVVRALYVVILLIALCFTYSNWFQYPAAGNLQSVANFAGVFFVAFSWIQLIAVVLLTPAMVAGTISLEHERRTIEYLLTSQLTCAEIVLGKLGARLLSVAFQLLAGLPVLALTMMLGGIAPQALAVVFVITLTSVMGLASLSMAVSVFARRAREAMTRIYLVLFALLVVPWVFWGMLSASGGGGIGILGRLQDALLWLLEGLVSVHPFYVLTAATTMPGPGGGSAWSYLLPMVASYSVFSLLCLAVAIRSVRRVYVKALGAGPPRARFTKRWWRPSLGSRAMLWKEMFAQRAALRLGWLGRIAAVLLGLAVIIPALAIFVDDLRSHGAFNVATNYSEFLGFVAGVGTAVSCVGLLLVATRAAGTITAEKERDSWTTLISTTLSPSEIILSKLAGNLYAARGWVLLLCFLWSLALVLRPDYALILPVVAATPALLAVFATALGMTFSLVCSNTLRAMGATLAVALFLGMGCCTPIFVIGFNGPESAIFMAPSALFLLIFSNVLAVEFTQNEVMMGGEFGIMATTYVVGMLLYGAATAGLLHYSIDRFDRLTGRTREVSLLESVQAHRVEASQHNIVSTSPPATAPRRSDPADD